MTAQSEQVHELRRELSRLRRRAASLRAVAAIQRRQTKLNLWAAVNIRKAEASQRGRAADRRDRLAQAHESAQASGGLDLRERERLADLRDQEADERDRRADLREIRADQRERLADERDLIADKRDLEADRRDRMADQRDMASDRREQVAFDNHLRMFRLERRLIRLVAPDGADQPQHNGQHRPQVDTGPASTIESQTA